MAQISIKILLERFTDVRGPVIDSSCLRKPREPWTLDEVVHLEVGFSEEQISWRIRLLFLKNKYVLDTLVRLLFLEHPKTTHSVGTIRGQHYHLVSKDETNSMDSQSAKVMDDTFSLSKITAASTTLSIQGYRQGWHQVMTSSEKSWSIWPKHTVCRFCQFFYRYNPFGDRFVKKNQCCF